MRYVNSIGRGIIHTPGEVMASREYLIDKPDGSGYEMNNGVESVALERADGVWLALAVAPNGSPLSPVGNEGEFASGQEAYQAAMDAAERWVAKLWEDDCLLDIWYGACGRVMRHADEKRKLVKDRFTVGARVIRVMRAVKDAALPVR